MLSIWEGSVCSLSVYYFCRAVRVMQEGADMQADLFRRHRRGDILVETGSYGGDGIQAALDAGFARVLSVELCPHLHARCLHRFARNSRVHLFLGDSSRTLWRMIRTVRGPMTFWLDGHWSGGGTARGNESYPILKELAVIASHRRNDHSILIDDGRKFSGRRGVPSVDDVRNALLSINGSYEISWDTKGGEGGRGDVLVASL